MTIARRSVAVSVLSHDKRGMGRGGGMMNESMGLTEANIEAWIAANGPGGKDKLGADLLSGRITGDTEQAVRGYFVRDAERFQVLESALATQVEPDLRALGVWEQHAAARWLGPLVIALALLAIVMLPIWSD